VVGAQRAERLTVRRTATGYWVVQRGGVRLAGGLTRAAAEHERELLERLRDRHDRRRAPRRADLRA
jgi:ribosomal protein L37AE/L43A